MRRTLLLILVTAVSPCFASAEDAPNIILVNIDDLGYGDIGPFGSKKNATPQLEQMAKEGRMLKSHYAAPVCSPSRASLMTGCYPKRALPIEHVLFPCSSVGLHPDELTIAEVLKGVGYATGCVGKWHLGDQPEFLPTRQGFDYYFGLPYSNDMGPVSDGAKSNPGKPIPERRKNANKPRSIVGIRRNQPPLPLLENEKVIERVKAAEQGTITRRYAQKAVEFISKHQNERFFLYLPHTAVHFPLYPAKEFRGKSGHGLFNDWVFEVDWAVRQVFKAVTALGLEKKTLIIFTSDNGGQPRHGAVNTPLRGAKGSTWEGGVRVPTIFWWPGKIPAGTSTNAITTTMDMFPTLAAIGGAEIPTNRKIDGVNIMPVLTGDGPAPRDQFFYFRGLNLQAVRKGPWKLHLAKTQLYNLESDIGESKNVAKDHPDVVADLRKLVVEMDKDLGKKGMGPGCRPLGKVANPQPLISLGGKVREGFAP